MATPERTGGDERARARAGHEYPQLYAPKALVLLSHYPFYNLFTQFLQQVCLYVCPRGRFGREHGCLCVGVGARLVSLPPDMIFGVFRVKTSGLFICGLSLASGAKRRLDVWEKTERHGWWWWLTVGLLTYFPSMLVGTVGGGGVHACCGLGVWLLLPVMRFLLRPIEV